MTSKIGYCCKTVKLDTKSGQPVSIPELNFKATTATWIKNNPKLAEQKLWEITEHNVHAMKRMVEYVGELHDNRRMVRVGSDVFPLFTHSEAQHFWSQAAPRDMARKVLEQVGDYCRSRNIRLSMHPGQFVVLASDRPDVVENSIAEFEYHTEIARMMGYGKSWHDHGFKINIHISGRNGPEGFLHTLGRLSPEARNLITIENEENSHGLEAVLSISKHVAVVPDIHHHWCREGEYIRRSDERIQRVIDSWRGVRPTLHYSVSREDILVGHDPTVLPDRDALIATGFSKQKLRAHSDYYWNTACNQWAIEFADAFDIQLESKCKNLAADKFVAEVYATLA